MDDKKKVDTTALEKFVEELLNKKGLDKNSEDYQTRKQVLLEELSEAIDSTLVNSLKDSDVQELNNLLDKNPTDEELQKFFRQKLPNMDEIVAKAMLEFARGYLAVKID